MTKELDDSIKELKDAIYLALKPLFIPILDLLNRIIIWHRNL